MTLTHVHREQGMYPGLFDDIAIKGPQSRLNGLKSLAKFFNFVVF